MHQKPFFATALLWAAFRDFSASKKLLDGADQLLRREQVFLLVKVGHTLRLDLGGSDHTVAEHAVHVLGGLALAPGVAALVVEVVVPGGGNALEGELLPIDGDLFLLCHKLSIAPFR